MKTINAFIHKYFWASCSIGLGILAISCFILFHKTYFELIGGYWFGFGSYAILDARIK